MSEDLPTSWVSFPLEQLRAEEKCTQRPLEPRPSLDALGGFSVVATKVKEGPEWETSLLPRPGPELWEVAAVVKEW